MPRKTIETKKINIQMFEKGKIAKAFGKTLKLS
jgi:hypothetical protein